MTCDLIVAHFQESLLWLNRVPSVFRRRIYHKGGQPQPGTLTLPNVGREAHSYLHHLVENYHCLPDISVFCQGHPFDHASDFHKVLRQIAANELPIPGFKWFGFIIDTDDKEGSRLFANWSKNTGRERLDIASFYPQLFGGPSPELFRFYPGAQFAVTRGQVLARPLSFYQTALNLSQEFENAAHIFERIWDRVFGCEGVDPALLQGGDCAYLKPIKRLQPGAG